MRFANKVLKLFLGAALGKAVQLMCLPLISRLFSAEELGVYGALLAVATISSVFIGLRLEIDYVGASDASRKRLISTFFSFSLLSSIILYMVAYVGFFDSWLAVPDGEDTALYYLVFILLAYSLSVYDFGLVILAVESRISRLALTRSFAGGGTGLAQVLMGLIGFVSALTLALSDVFARLATSLDLMKRWRVTDFNADFLLSANRAWVVSSAFMNRLSNNLPYILIGYCFGASFVGFYFLTQRAIGGGNVLLGQAISSAFLSDIAYKLKEKESVSSVWVDVKRLVSRSALLSFPVFLFISLLGYFYLGEMFGAEWDVYSLAWLYITSLYFFQFVFSPVSQVLNFIGRSDVQTFWESLRLALVSFAFLPAIYSGYGFYECVVLLSLSYFVSYLVLLGLVRFYLFRHEH